MKKISKLDFTGINITGLWEIPRSEETKQTHRTYLQNTYRIKDLYPRHTKNSWKLTIEKKLKTGKRIWTETSPKKITQIRYGERNCSTSRQWNIIHQLKRNELLSHEKRHRVNANECYYVQGVCLGTSPAGQWLRHCTPSSEDPGSTPS